MLCLKAKERIIKKEYKTNKFLIRHLANVGGNTVYSNPVDAYIYGYGPSGVTEAGAFTLKEWNTSTNSTDKLDQMSQRMTQVLNTF